MRVARACNDIAAIARLLFAGAHVWGIKCPLVLAAAPTLSQPLLVHEAAERQVDMAIAAQIIEARLPSNKSPEPGRERHK
jgi:hypothetical protein